MDWTGTDFQFSLEQTILGILRFSFQALSSGMLGKFTYKLQFYVAAFLIFYTISLASRTNICLKFNNKINSWILIDIQN